MKTGRAGFSGGFGAGYAENPTASGATATSGSVLTAPTVCPESTARPFSVPQADS